MTKIYLSQLLTSIAQNTDGNAYAVIDMDEREKKLFGKIDKNGEFLKYAILALNNNPIVYDMKRMQGFDEAVIISCRPDV